MRLLRKTSWIALIAAMGLSGCAVNNDIADGVDGLSRSAGNAKNQMLLLNLVRASKGHPMFFTAIPSVTGITSGNASLAFSIPFGKDALHSYGVQPSLGASNGPSYSVVPVESSQFYQGFLNPIATNTLGYFIQQGYPREVIFYLLLQKFSVTLPTGSTQYLNDPYEESFTGFQGGLRRALQDGLTIGTQSSMTDIGPPVSAAQLNIAALGEVMKAGLLLRPVDAKQTRFQIFSAKASARFCFDQALASSKLPASAAPLLCSADAAGGDAGASAARGNFSFDQNNANIEMQTRSMADVFRFLGALITAQNPAPGNRSPVVPKILVESREAQVYGAAQPQADLFIVQKNANSSNALVSVTYEGDTYSIPSGSATSGRVLALLGQLLALNTSVNDLQASNTVTLIGR